MFKRLGLDKDRIHLEGHSANVKIHLDRYRNLDIALDTFPYTGCTTTDALWMGVPVFTVAGSSMVSRQAASVLNGAGHPEWICQSREELRDKVKEILSNQKLLADTRKNLRKEIMSSELLDHKELADELHRTFKSGGKSF